jgi:hypothetical protein
VRRKFEIGEVIAERQMTYVANDGSSTAVSVHVGKPIPDPSAEHGDWFCPYKISGLGDSEVRAIFGVDSMQALLLAIHTIPAELAAHIRNQGGRFQSYGHDDASFILSCRVVLKYSGDVFESTEG